MGIKKRKKLRPKIRQKIKRAPKKLSNEKDVKLKSLWNPKKTLKQNYQTYGLSYSENNPMHTTVDVLEMDEETLLEIQQLEQQETVNKDSNEKFDELFVPGEEVQQDVRQNEDDRNYAKALIDKHGDNYKAMERDIKLNYWQHTAKQCKRECLLFVRKYAGSQPLGKRGQRIMAVQKQKEHTKAARLSKKKSTAININ